MALNASIPVRISAETRARLEAISAQSGLSVSDLIRRAAEEFIDETAARGSLNIPVQISGDQVAAFGGKIGNRMVAEKRERYGANRKRK